AGSSLIAPRIMGQQRTFALLAIGEGWSARDAREAGIVNRVVEAGELEAAAIAAARDLAGKPPEALRLARNLIRGDRADVLARMREEGRIFTERLQSDEARAAFMAFMAKGRHKA
ncbi:MAG: enoyl-CoA hydratase, partial [Nitratireductor sp.]|nr:enoyl-CoA hydratase [Nitratireductor sp.]